jgi:hypothetical protein
MADDKSPFMLALLAGGVGAALLADMAKNIRDRYYKNQTIFLDGYTFTNCCFHNCTLVSNTGAFALHSCTLANYTLQFGPNAVRLIKLFNLLSPQNPWPTFGPAVAPDGAVTVL